jgi:hypothetical protein
MGLLPVSAPDFRPARSIHAGNDFRKAAPIANTAMPLPGRRNTYTIS